MPGGKLPRARDRARDPARRAQLRACATSATTTCRLGLRAGLSDDAHRARAGREAGAGAARGAILRATDELHATRDDPRPHLWAGCARTSTDQRADRAVHARRPLRDARHDAERARACSRMPDAGQRTGSAASPGDWRSAADRPARRPTRRDHGRRAWDRRTHRAPPAASAALRSRSSASSPSCCEDVAAGCGGAPWFECDVADRAQVDDAVAAAVDRARRPRRRDRQRRASARR